MAATVAVGAFKTMSPTLGMDVSIPGEDVRVELGNRARSNENFMCKDAALAMFQYLESIQHQRYFAEIWFLGPTGKGIYGAEFIHVATISGGVFDPGTVISMTGWHVGVLFGGSIFCNVHPGGLPSNLWFADFTGPGERLTKIHPGPYPIGPPLP